jgi:hypothetical protein
MVIIRGVYTDYVPANLHTILSGKLQSVEFQPQVNRGSIFISDPAMLRQIEGWLNGAKRSHQIDPAVAQCRMVLTFADGRREEILVSATGGGAGIRPDSNSSIIQHFAEEESTFANDFCIIDWNGRLFIAEHEPLTAYLKRMNQFYPAQTSTTTYRSDEKIVPGTRKRG